jgi:hypothetical protein
MHNTALDDRVRQLLASGQLPRDAATKVIAGYGDGSPCAVCKRTMRAADVIYELIYGKGEEAESRVMHFECFAAWDRVRPGNAPE